MAVSDILALLSDSDFNAVGASEEEEFNADLISDSIFVVSALASVCSIALEGSFTTSKAV